MKILPVENAVELCGNALKCLQIDTPENALKSFSGVQSIVSDMIST